MKAAQAAREAARIMSEKGHCKNALENDQGQVCYAGALVTALTGKMSLLCTMTTEQTALFWDIMRESDAILAGRGYKNSSFHWGKELFLRDPVSFNNDPSVTGEDVILLLKETAERLEEA